MRADAAPIVETPLWRPHAPAPGRSISGQEAALMIRNVPRVLIEAGRGGGKTAVALARFSQGGVLTPEAAILADIRVAIGREQDRAAREQRERRLHDPAVDERLGRRQRPREGAGLVLHDHRERQHDHEEFHKPKAGRKPIRCRSRLHGQPFP